MTITYTCALCGETFRSDYPEDTDRQEREAIFGSIPDEDCDVVCDDCFNQIDPRKQENASVFADWKADRPNHDR